MIKIEITDPHLLSEKALVDIAAYLMRVAGHDLERAPEKPVLIKAPEIQVTANEVAFPDVPEPEDLVPMSNREELDSAGKVWDKDIHSRTKSKNADGTWKIQRGKLEVTETVRPQVPSAPPSPPIPPPFAPATYDSLPAQPKEMTFIDLMGKITDSISKNKITHSKILSIVQSLDIPSIALISTRPDLVPVVSDLIDLEIK